MKRRPPGRTDAAHAPDPPPGPRACPAAGGGATPRIEISAEEAVLPLVRRPELAGRCRPAGLVPSDLLTDRRVLGVLLRPDPDAGLTGRRGDCAERAGHRRCRPACRLDEHVRVHLRGELALG